MPCLGKPDWPFEVAKTAGSADSIMACIHGKVKPRSIMNTNAEEAAPDTTWQELSLQLMVMFWSPIGLQSDSKIALKL